MMNDDENLNSAHPFKHHCFLSYTHRDPDTSQLQGPLADFAKGLQRKGFSVHKWAWVDFDRLGRGNFTDSALARALQTGIDESVAVIAFVSPKYVTSPWCQFEWMYRDRDSGRRAPRRSVVWKDIGNPHALNYPDRAVAEGAWSCALPFKPIPADSDQSLHPGSPLHDRNNWHKAIEAAADFLAEAHASRLKRWEALNGGWPAF